jgi:hypothetical protein
MMDTVFRSNQVRNSMKRINDSITRAWSSDPAFPARVRVGVELPYDDGSQLDRWLSEIDHRRSTALRPLDCDLTRGGVHVNPSTFLMPIDRVIGLRIRPSLVHGSLNGRFVA